MKTLTYAALKGAGTCPAQRALFKKLFGKSVEVTEALCVEHAGAFNWSWAADHLLSDSARIEYDRVRAPARAEYRVGPSAWAEYDRVCASAWALAYINDFSKA